MWSPVDVDGYYSMLNRSTLRQTELPGLSSIPRKKRSTFSGRNGNPTTKHRKAQTCGTGWLGAEIAGDGSSDAHGKQRQLDWPHFFGQSHPLSGRSQEPPPPLNNFRLSSPAKKSTYLPQLKFDKNRRELESAKKLEPANRSTHRACPKGGKDQKLHKVAEVLVPASPPPRTSGKMGARGAPSGKKGRGWAAGTRGSKALTPSTKYGNVAKKDIGLRQLTKKSLSLPSC